jgi:putative ABC transport system permease protein
MLRNYLAATLRNLVRNRLYSSISVAGLGIGLCGALLAMLVVRSQLTQDRFIPGYAQLYLAATKTRTQGGLVDYSRSSDGRVAALLKQRTPAVQLTGRLALENGGLQNGENAAGELISWADPDFFDVARFPVVAGNLATALRRPDGLVLDRHTARRYFGRDNPVGESLQLRGAASRELHTMTVTAVIEDLPVGGTSFQTGIFASGLASYSMLAQVDRTPAATANSDAPGVFTYVRLASGESIPAIEAGLSQLLNALSKSVDGSSTALELVRIDRLNRHEGLSPGVASKLALILLLGLVILLVATVNYINLFTARADRRALEVGIRKVSGATNGVLVRQFLVESCVYAALGTLLAIALTEWSLPYVNAFLNTGATFHYWREPGLLVLLLATPVVVGVLAGAWPALALCAFRPGVALSGARPRSSGGGLARQVLVTVQFALLISLMICASVVFRQRHFALHQALRLNTDQILMVWAPCREAFLNDLRKIPGVRGFACGGWQWLNEEPNRFTARALDGSAVNLWRVPVDLAVFDLYGLRPVAGRTTLDEAGRQYPRDARQYVINESAARRLGFRTAQEAVGQRVAIPSVVPGATAGGEQIIGVIPDFSLVSVEKEIKPVVYFFEPSQQHLISVKLAGSDMAATLAGIDRAWAATGAKEPSNHFFLDQRLEQLYLSMLRQAQAFGVFAVVTLLLTAFGLFGLAMASVARRTREIGIRKALGANTGDVLRLLLWQFSKPVLWANLIAWPVAGWGMQHWLDGFAYRIELPVWLFPAAAAAALLIALLTVATHSILVARAKPVVALRHE